MASGAQVPPWQLWDTRVLTQQAQRQGMRLRWDDKHYLPIAYEVSQTYKLQPRNRTNAQTACGHSYFGHSCSTGSMCIPQPDSGKRCCSSHLRATAHLCKF